MAFFAWKGIKDGKPAEGQVEARDRNDASAQLMQQKTIVTSISEVGGSKKRKSKKTKEVQMAKKPPRSVPLDDVALFTKKLATMIRSGLPILETIKMLRDQTEHKGMKYVVNEIYNDVETGTGLSDAFNKHRQVFDNVYINMLRAGESSGQIDEFMAKLVEGMQKQQAIRKKVKGALSYPIILLTVAIGVITLMMIYVVPVFQDMFKSAEGGLPAPTQIVVNISGFLRDPAGGGLLAGIIITSVVAFKTAIRRSIKFKRAVDQTVMKLPVVGELVRNSSLAKIAMIQGNLTAAGVSVIDSLDIATRSLDNTVVQDAMNSIKRGVFGGAPLSDLYKREEHIFPMTFSAMVQVGERTGRMDEMLASMAEYYEEETEASVDALTGLLEPVMIVFMGSTIGGTLVAMYLPMFAMGQAL